jgi:hypothetical protein
MSDLKEGAARPTDRFKEARAEGDGDETGDRQVATPDDRYRRTPSRTRATSSTREPKR